MSIQRRQVCVCCKQSMIEHRQTLTCGLVKSLWQAYKMRGQNMFKVAELDLTHSEQANWQKLRYWDLVEKVKGFHGKWCISLEGVWFLLGSYRMPHAVWTYHGKVVDRDRSKLVGPGDCWDGYKERSAWMREARDRNPPQQPEIPGLTAAAKTV